MRRSTKFISHADSGPCEKLIEKGEKKPIKPRVWNKPLMEPSFTGTLECWVMTTNCGRNRAVDLESYTQSLLSLSVALCYFSCLGWFNVLQNGSIDNLSPSQSIVKAKSDHIDFCLKVHTKNKLLREALLSDPRKAYQPALRVQSNAVPSFFLLSQLGPPY